LFEVLCILGTLGLISSITNAPSNVVDGSFENHFSELRVPTPRTHGLAERALDRRKKGFGRGSLEIFTSDLVNKTENMI